LGKKANLADFVAPSHLKWEAGCQECQPTALGPLGLLDKNVRFFVFLPKLLSPKRYAVWQDDDGRTQRICLLCPSLADSFGVGDEMNWRLVFGLRVREKARTFGWMPNVTKKRCFYLKRLPTP
jgi:hypothetical protein